MPRQHKPPRNTRRVLRVPQVLRLKEEKKVSNAMLDFLFDTKLPIYNNIKYLSDMNIN